MNKKKIISIALATTIIAGGGEYAITEQNIDTFKRHLQTFEMREDRADSVARYMKGGLFNGKDTIDPNSAREYSKACNRALKAFKGVYGSDYEGDKVDFGSITHSDVTKLCNGLISDIDVQDYYKATKQINYVSPEEFEEKNPNYKRIK